VRWWEVVRITGWIILGCCSIQVITPRDGFYYGGDIGEFGDAFIQLDGY
jgi:hypothetical protein